MPNQNSLDLEESFFETDQVRWRRAIPALHLIETVRLSLDPRKVILATIAVVLFGLIHQGVNRLPFAPDSPNRFSQSLGLILATQHLPSDQEPELLINGSWSHMSTSAERLLAVDNVVPKPLWEAISSKSIAACAYHTTLLIAGLILWAVFGGAVARITALQFAGDHPASLSQALRFAVGHLGASVFAPLLPVSGILAVWLMVFLGGWIAQIPVVGPIVGGLFWGLTLLLGFIAVLLFIGVLLSWPLMICATSVEGTDAFDSLSRGFSYVFSRPIYFVVLIVTAGIVGALLSTLAMLVVEMTHLISVQFFGSSGADLFNSDGFGQLAAAFWNQTMWMLGASFGVAYFWVAATVIYFLLRLSVDAMPLDRIYLPEDTEVDDLAPLVGIAEADRREAMRKESQSADADESQNNPDAAPSNAKAGDNLETTQSDDE